ncbi:hypothetical protein BX070DRAFT_56095 [Coemansia spiralis]|nr:hypothetical protein BX070DRAFT_56095 [Coemansia spiralis]
MLIVAALLGLVLGESVLSLQPCLCDFCCGFSLLPMMRVLFWAPAHLPSFARLLLRDIRNILLLAFSIFSFLPADWLCFVVYFAMASKLFLVMDVAINCDANTHAVVRVASAPTNAAHTTQPARSTYFSYPVDMWMCAVLIFNPCILYLCCCCHGHCFLL